MSTLYEITGEFLEILNMLNDDEVDEQLILDTLEGVECEFESKADNIAKFIRSLEGRINAVEKEVERLNNRKKVFENKIKSMKQYLHSSMKVTGKTKFTTDLFSFNIQKNGGKRTLTIDVDLELIPEDYKIEQPDKVDGDKVREYLKENGIEGQDGSINCDFAHLEPQGESLRIK